MVDWEEIETTLNYLYETFLEDWYKILSVSFVAFLSLPVIEWFILSIKYMILQNPESLSKFAESTVWNLLPSWIDLILDPIGSVFLFVCVVLVITCIFALIRSRE